MSDEIRRGDPVIAVDADGIEHVVTALSGVEVKGHSFPVIWINIPKKAGGFEPCPWPAESVRPRGGGPKP